MRESLLILISAKLVDYEKCLCSWLCTYVPLGIYAFIIEAAHFRSQWVAFMGSNLKVSAVISELVIDFFFK